MTINPKDLELIPKPLHKLVKLLMMDAYAEGELDMLKSDSMLDKSLYPLPL